MLRPQFFYSSSQIAQVDRIILAGGCAAIEGAGEVITDKTGVEVAIANPFADMSLSSKIKPQVLANDYIVDFDHPQHGATKMVGLPVGLSETPGAVREPAPELGQHTEEVLLEMGLDWEKIAALKESGVIP